MSDQIICLALAIYFEARSEPMTEQYRIAHVVMERTKQNGERTPEAVCAVVWADKQFALTRRPTISYDAQAYRVAKQIGYNVWHGLDNGAFACPGATHFHSIADKRPEWSLGMRVLCRGSAHVFY